MPIISPCDTSRSLNVEVSRSHSERDRREQGLFNENVIDLNNTANDLLSPVVMAPAQLHRMYNLCQTLKRVSKDSMSQYQILHPSPCHSDENLPNVYQQHVSDGSSYSAPLQTVCRASGHLVRGRVDDNEDVYRIDTEAPPLIEDKSRLSQAVVSREENDAGCYLVNKGSDPVDIKLMTKQIRNGNIVLLTTQRVTVKSMINSIIRKDVFSLDGEYLFALSASRGLRIITQGPNRMGFDEYALHHQNIFINDRDILSVGMMFLQKNKLMITNFSGHFKPDEKSLKYIKQYLIGHGVSKNKIIISDYKKQSSLLMNKKSCVIS